MLNIPSTKTLLHDSVIIGSPFPEDILIEILKRLPVKSLMRLRRVSKAWLSLITNTKFINIHLEFQLKNHHQTEKFYILSKTPSPRRSARLNKKNKFLQCDETMAERNVLFFPFESLSGGFFTIVSACNGVLCLTELKPCSYGRVVYLWNPSVKRVKILRESVVEPLPKGRGAAKVALGFGFDELNCDCKVVRIFYSLFIDPIVEVYSLNKDAWHRLESRFPRVLSLSTSCHAYLHGAVHWMSDGECVIGFDLSSEQAREIALPDIDSTESDYELDENIWVYKGMLAMTSWCIDNEDEDGPIRISIWAMNDYKDQESWTRLFVVDDIEFQVRKNIICFGWRDEIFLQKDDCIISYQVDSNLLKDCGYHILKDIVCYTESLLLLDKGRDVFEYYKSLKGISNKGIELVIERKIEGVVYDGINILIKDDEEGEIREA